MNLIRICLSLCALAAGAPLLGACGAMTGGAYGYAGGPSASIQHQRPYSDRCYTSAPPSSGCVGD